MRPHFQGRIYWLLLTLFLLLQASVPGQTIFAYEVNKNAVALLLVKGADNQAFSTGSGFVVKPDGTLVTNYHVLIDAVSVEAVFPNGVSAAVKGVYKVDREKDFAVLKLDGEAFSTLELGDSGKLKAYDYASALGYLTQEAAEKAIEERQNQSPNALRQTHGFVLGIHPQADPESLAIYATTPLGPGFSGGPLVDKDNRVVGVAMVESRAINLAIPINYVKPFLDSKTFVSLGKVLDADRNARETLYYKGNAALYGLGDTERAVFFFNKALTQDPNYVLAHYDLAAAYRDMGEIDKAIAEYEKVLRINPHFPEALTNLGGHYFRSGSIPEAVKLFKDAIRVFPNFVQALSNLGAALNKLGKPDEAVPHLEKTLRLDPAFAMAHYNLGNAYFAQNRLDQALTSYEKAAELGLDFLSLHWNLFEIHKREGRIREAVKELNLILEIDPSDEKAGQLLKEMGGAKR
jgi:tetratricopeptide (TPR) repeat protein